MDWSKQIGKWYEIPEIRDFVSTPYMRRVLSYLSDHYQKVIIHPNKQDVFKCFKKCDPSKLKVVILGQDPYYDGNATGLAFANDEDKLRMSPSLEKIKNTVERTVYNGLNFGFDQTLESWADQGVLLLNTSLTVQSGKPTSHFRIWDLFTKNILKIISKNFPGTIFVLWGNKAQTYEKGKGYDLSINCNVVKAIHPAACVHNKTFWTHNNFNEINNIIRDQNGEEFCIKW